VSSFGRNDKIYGEVGELGTEVFGLKRYGRIGLVEFFGILTPSTTLRVRMTAGTADGKDRRWQGRTTATARARERATADP
jgi:hypothetical protein